MLSFYTLSDNINTDDLQLKKNLLLAAKPNFRRCCTASASHQSKLWPPANLVFLRISVTPNISYFSHSDILAAPAVLIALHVRLTVAIDFASSIHSLSDHLAAIMTFRHYFLNCKLISFLL